MQWRWWYDSQCWQFDLRWGTGSESKFVGVAWPTHAAGVGTMCTFGHWSLPFERFDARRHLVHFASILEYVCLWGCNYCIFGCRLSSKLTSVVYYTARSSASSFANSMMFSFRFRNRKQDLILESTAIESWVWLSQSYWLLKLSWAIAVRPYLPKRMRRTMTAGISQIACMLIPTAIRMLHRDTDRIDLQFHLKRRNLSPAGCLKFAID